MWEWGVRRGMRELGRSALRFESTRAIWGWETGCVEKTKGVKRILNVGLAPAGDDSEKADGRHRAHRNLRLGVWVSVDSQHRLTHSENSLVNCETPCFHPPP